ncbi:MAG: rRNA maturation RNase YbeY [Ruminococcaceae bacterium]|nr:rRNA maturation RNase YbeY [Oscillospiraceae bacterium]
MKIKIYWSNEQKKTRVNLGLKILITRAIAAALECEGWHQPSTVSVTFTDNEGIREKNREFRGIDAPTDVLSFPMYDMQNDDTPDPDTVAELGDIVLSLEKAYEQSVEFGHSYKRECAFLTVHSVLHLLGYDHMEPEEEEEMRARQRIIMKKLGLER